MPESDPYAYTPDDLDEVKPCGCHLTFTKTIMCEEHWDQMQEALKEDDA